MEISADAPVHCCWIGAKGVALKVLDKCKSFADTAIRVRRAFSIFLAMFVLLLGSGALEAVHLSTDHAFSKPCASASPAGLSIVQDHQSDHFEAVGSVDSDCLTCRALHVPVDQMGRLLGLDVDLGLARQRVPALVARVDGWSIPVRIDCCGPPTV